MGVTVTTGCAEPAPFALEVVEPCNQAPLAEAEQISVRALELDTGESWSSTFSAGSGNGELPEIPIGSRVAFEVSLLKEGEVYAWAEAKPFEMGAETQISPQLQPSRIGAFTQPHAPDSADTCAGYETPRIGAHLLSLRDGDVLHIGGYDLGEQMTFVRGVERWSARDNSIEAVGNLAFPRVDDSATQLSDGAWILSGGRSENVQGATGARETTHFTLALHISAAGEIDDTPGVLTTGRSGHSAMLLDDGRIWLIGGRGNLGAIVETEFYNPSTKTSEVGPSLSVGRWNAGIIQLANDTAVLVGGENETGVLDSIEVVKISDSTGTISAVGLSEARTRPIIARDGTTFWVVGGGLVPGDDFNLGQGSTAIDVLERGGDGFELLCGDTALALADGRFLASSLQDEDALYLAGGLDENGVLLKSFTRVLFSDLRECSPALGEDLTILKEARAYSGAVVLDSGAMMFGGGFSRQSGTPSTSALVEIYRSAR